MIAVKFAIGLLFGFLLICPGLCQAGPCDVVTTQEAAAILGEEVKPVRHQLIEAMAAGHSCTWFTAAPIAKRGGAGSLKVVFYDKNTMADKGIVFNDPAKYFAKNLDVKKKSGHNKIEKIAGLGNAAFWENGPNTLHILLPDNYIQVQVKDLAEISGSSKEELNAKVSAHQKDLALKFAHQTLLPRLQTQ